MGKTIAEAGEDEVLCLVRAGWTYPEVGRITGVRAGTVQRFAHSRGVRRRRGNRRDRQLLPDSALAETARLYLVERLSIAEVGRRIGVGHRAVIWRLDLAGVPRRSRAEAMRVAHAEGRRDGVRYARGAGA